MAFSCMDGDIIKLIISLIRPRLGYTASVWSPKTKENIKKMGEGAKSSYQDSTRIEGFVYEE